MGRTLTFTLAPDSILLELVMKIWEREGIPPSQIRLIYSAMEITPYQFSALTDLHAYSECSFHLILRLQGTNSKPPIESSYDRLCADIKSLQSPNGGVDDCSDPVIKLSAHAEAIVAVNRPTNVKPYSTRIPIPDGTPAAVAAQLRASEKARRLEDYLWMKQCYDAIPERMIRPPPFRDDDSTAAAAPEAPAAAVDDSWYDRIDWRRPNHEMKTLALSAIIDCCGTNSASGGSSGGGLPDEICYLISSYTDYRIERTNSNFQIYIKTLSDERLKSDITTERITRIDGGSGSAVRVVRSVRWKWTPEAGELFQLFGSGEGVIAQEVAQYCPEAVSYDESNRFLQINCAAFLRWLRRHNIQL